LAPQSRPAAWQRDLCRPSARRPRSGLSPRGAERCPAARAVAEAEGEHRPRGRVGAAARRCWAAYLSVLAERPLLTKASTAAALAALGDVLAQLVALAGSAGGYQPLDVPRFLRFAAVNGILVAPTFHIWYGWLARRIPGIGMRWALLRMLPDQLLFSPVFLYVFLLSVRSLGAQPPTWQPPSLELWWTASCINWLVLPVTQFLNFWLIPVPRQVLFSNVVAVGMSAVMSYVTARG